QVGGDHPCRRQMGAALSVELTRAQMQRDSSGLVGIEEDQVIGRLCWRALQVLPAIFHSEVLALVRRDAEEAAGHLHHNRVQFYSVEQGVFQVVVQHHL